jgi:hypothetical protein
MSYSIASGVHVSKQVDCVCYICWCISMGTDHAPLMHQNAHENGGGQIEPRSWTQSLSHVGEELEGYHKDRHFYLWIRGQNKNTDLHMEKGTSMVTSTHPQHSPSPSPMTWASSNCWSRGFVKMLAVFSHNGSQACSKSLDKARSQMKWCLISMCFTFECNKELWAREIALSLSLRTKIGGEMVILASVRDDWSQSLSWNMSPIAMYSASVEERAIDFCFFNPQASVQEPWVSWDRALIKFACPVGVRECNKSGFSVTPISKAQGFHSF